MIQKDNNLKRLLYRIEAKLSKINRLSENRLFGRFQRRKSFSINTKFFGFCILGQPVKMRPLIVPDNDGGGVCVEDGDCDDNNAHIYPGHPDKGCRWGKDGLVNDCNGTIDG